MPYVSLRALAALAFVLSVAVPAMAVTERATHHATFDVTIKPQIGTGFPRTGTMSLTFHSGGIVDGTYRGNSIAPDPLNNRITSVTGGLAPHNRIWIDIGIRGRMHFSGTLEHNVLQLSGVMKGRVYLLTGRLAK